jgi:hypothetical protein
MTDRQDLWLMDDNRIEGLGIEETVAAGGMLHQCA